MIDSYSFGKIVINGEKYSSDVKIFSDHVEGNWWRKHGHRLLPEDIEDIIDASPDTLIVGTGANGRLTVPSETKEYIKSNGIELIVDKSERAVEKFNELVGEKEMAAAIHLTC